MIIDHLDLLWVNHARMLFNSCVQKGELLYKPLSSEQFTGKMTSKDPLVDCKTYLDIDDEELTGFMSGVIVKDKHKAYVTTIIVDPRYRRQGIGSKLLTRFENDVKNEYPMIQTIDIVFFNPKSFEWIIPKTKDHDHPNAPGVDLESSAIHFFQHHGYSQFAKQNSYYKNVEHYELSDDIKSIMSELKKINIEITYYNPNIHHGFNALFEDLKNPYWNDEIKKACEQQEPILIACKDKEIIGFTGPLRVQPSKRGYFAGIGVHSGYRSHGIGKVLFASLCHELKNRGAHFMTLFTGETNPARKIYEREGFTIVKSWANLRKEIKS